MKVCQLGLIVAALFVSAQLSASQALAAGGVLSDDTLSAMGLSGLHVMSDSEGLAVRGLGFSGGASAAGKSWASVAGYGASAGSTNSYNANGGHSASGDNVSFAGIEVKKSGGGYGGNDCYNPCYNPCKPQTIKITAIAGGSSSGHR